ncbi:hypothetical protein POM88_025541 [Heracleum sosnowskyi]|uniref:RNase H type-1 domain-containing protein n=1 Tax=Heracleum sosnowskyi TaxID=360622 RepID=A0AAD8MN09_9APIA|nr:hypothetical protein POM88_025541 [Heracleum sosnowskyi]
MAKYLKLVKAIMTQFDECYVEHIPREENMKADALSKFDSSDIENYVGSVYFQVLKTPSINGKLIAPIDISGCWIDPIKAHLETGWLSNNALEARKLTVRALRYALIEGILYKKSFVIPYLKCLRPQEAELVLKEVHEGIFAHPQAYRQAKVANRIILDGLKKRVECSSNTWVDELLPILWAYHTTYKVTTEATPFMLDYGAEAVVPVEITHTSPKVGAFEPESNEEGMRLALDLIDEVRDEANAKIVKHHKRASSYYNLRVKERFFRQGDLVLRKIEAYGVGHKGKLAPN